MKAAPKVCRTHSVLWLLAAAWSASAVLATAPAGAAETKTIPVVPVRAQASSPLGSTEVDISGYIKLDILYSRFDKGEVAQGGGRDFYLPNSIPVSADGGQGRSFMDFHAKETRLVIKTETPFEGYKIGTHIEADFIVNQGAGNEVVTNAYNLGFRRAFVTYSNFLIGQEWSTFQNLGVLPETLDFVAFPSNGTIFVRQPQVRYTFGGFQLALENPETTVLPAGGGAVSASGDAVVPDLVLRYNFKLGDNEFSVAGLARQLSVENAAVGGDNPVPAVEDSVSAGGATLSGKIPLGDDNLMFQVVAGNGVGRYVALATSADAVLSNGELEPIGLIAGYVAYKHLWNSQWRSTATAAYFSADNDPQQTGTAVTSKAASYSVNLLYSPAPKLTFGLEARRATREVESGADGALTRLQFSTKYAF